MTFPSSGEGVATPIGPTTSLQVSARTDADDTTYRGNLGDLRVELTVHPSAPASGDYVVTMNVIAGPQGFAGVVHCELVGAGPELLADGPADSGGGSPWQPRFHLPAFMVGHNRGQAPMGTPRQFPRIRAGEPNAPASPWWMTRADRLAAPVALAYGQGRLVAISSSPYLQGSSSQSRGWEPGARGDFLGFTGFTCSLESASVGFTLGAEEAPWSFVQSLDVRERSPLESSLLTLAPGGRASVELWFWDRECGPDERIAPDVDAVMRQVYSRFHESPRAVGDPHRAARDLSRAIRDAAWQEDTSSYAGFVFEEPDGSHSYRALESLTWTNGLAVAMPMLIAGLRLEDEEMRRQALAFFDTVVPSSLNSRSGLPFDSKNEGQWGLGGWWFDLLGSRGHSGYLVGQAIDYILEAAHYERQLAGVEHEDWIDFARGVVSQLQRSRNAEGEYPFILSDQNGLGLEFDSMGPAWCLSAAAYLAQVSGNLEDLPDLLVSEQHYYDRYVAPLECYGGPLDVAKATDSEGIIGYLRAVRRLHELTGAEYLLDHMRDALGYEFLFRFGWNVPVQVPPLARVGWSSCGGTVTSVANPHIHPMGSLLVDELIYYSWHRDDDYVRSRLSDALRWGMQTYNTFDREFDHGLVGWMSERFCHSAGLLTERYPDGSPASTWFCLMPWGGSCVIRGYVGQAWDDPQLWTGMGVGEGRPEAQREAPLMP